MAKRAKRKVGRPTKLTPPTPPSEKTEIPPHLIPEFQVETLAAMACTNEEIAAALGVSADTIERNFAGAIKRGKLKGFVSVKRKLYNLATEGKGNLGALIWFGKQYMGWKDTVTPEPPPPDKDVTYDTAWSTVLPDEKKS